MKSAKRVMLILGIALIAGLILIGLFGNKTANTIDFPPLSTDIQALISSYPDTFGQKVDILSNEDGVHTVCSWILYKSMAAAQAPDWEQSLSQFLSSEMGLVTSIDMNADFWASQTAFDLLADLYSGVPGTRDRILSLCSTAAPTLKLHIDNELNTFASFANVEHFTDSRGLLIENKRPIVQLLHRYQWTKLASQQLPLQRIRLPEETILTYRWQIEQSALAFDQKLERIDRMENEFPGIYDAPFARAVLYFKNKDIASACAILKNTIPSLNDPEKLKYYNDAAAAMKKLNSAACQ